MGLRFIVGRASGPRSFWPFAWPQELGGGVRPLLHSSGQMSQSNWARVPVDSAAGRLRLYRAGWLWSVGYLDVCEHQGNVGVASDAAAAKKAESANPVLPAQPRDARIDQP